MKQPYKARVCEQHFLNLPGFHAGAYVRAYVEDTSERGIEKADYGDREYNPEPRMILEIADCTNRIDLEFELDSAVRRQNSFHKIDTLIEALQVFRAGLAEESTLYKQRERQMRGEGDEGGGKQELRSVA